MPTNYTGNPTAVEAPASAPGPGVAPILALPNDGEPVNAAAFAQAYKVCADYIAYLQLQAIGSPFGNGSDGNATLDGTNTVSWASKVGSVYTMTRDCFCSNLTVTGAGTILKPAGYRIFCRGTLTTSASGVITSDGAAGSGTTAGAAGSTGTILSGGAGGSGGSSGSPGVGASNQTAFGGSGGHGGNGAVSGGAGGTVTNPGASLGNPNLFAPGLAGFIQGLSGTTPTITGIFGGAGGGGGSGGTGENGGGGGAGGGVIAVCARVISLANASDIHCNGGTGANASGTGTGGGGAGGGGGVLIIAYGSKNAVTFSAATNCAAGSGGTGTNTGLTAASNGTVYEFLLS